jgi:hypothetical protein
MCGQAGSTSSSYSTPVSENCKLDFLTFGNGLKIFFSIMVITSSK